MLPIVDGAGEARHATISGKHLKASGISLFPGLFLCNLFYHSCSRRFPFLAFRGVGLLASRTARKPTVRCNVGSSVVESGSLIQGLQDIGSTPFRMFSPACTTTSWQPLFLLQRDLNTRQVHQWLKPGFHKSLPGTSRTYQRPRLVSARAHKVRFLRQARYCSSAGKCNPCQPTGEVSARHGRDGSRSTFQWWHVSSRELYPHTHQAREGYSSRLLLGRCRDSWLHR